MKKVAVIVVAGMTLSGCWNWPTHNRVVNGAIIGGTAGGVIGGVATGNAGGVLAGIGIGAATGAVVAAATK
jgi:hypothetical protein